MSKLRLKAVRHWSPCFFRMARHGFLKVAGVEGAGGCVHKQSTWGSLIVFTTGLTRRLSGSASNFQLQHSVQTLKYAGCTYGLRLSCHFAAVPLHHESITSTHAASVLLNAIVSPSMSLYSYLSLLLYSSTALYFHAMKMVPEFHCPGRSSLCMLGRDTAGAV